MFKQILTVLLSAFVIDAHDFNICHSTNSINLKSIQLNPDPPVAGKNLKVTLQGTSPLDISSPTANLQFSVLGIPVSHLSLDICSQNSCPVKSNDEYSWVVNYPIPDDHPGDMKIDVTLSIDDNNSTVGCYELETNINDQEAQLTWETPP